MKKSILFLIISAASLHAQQFTEMTSISLSGVQESSVAWGDYDNDGDLDLLLTGNDGSNVISKIYNNNGGSFSEASSISLTGVYRSSVAWGDYDNDSYIDILLTGRTASGSTSKIYKNNGSGNFVEQSSIVIQSCYYSSASWCDYDNDGDLDFLISGKVSDGGGSLLYKNNGDNTFTHQSSISLPSISEGANAWGDYDNDGYMDLLFTGDAGTAGLTKIYKNDGSGNFTEQSSISLIGVENSSAAWGDYDNDGDLDFLISGATGSSSQSVIYKNNGNGTFSEQTSIKLANIHSGSAAWGDYDNDGYLDILLTGLGSSRVSKVYKNNGSGNFSEQEDITLTAVYYSSVAWGDYDNDGDLDILISGNSQSGRISKIYRNNASTANTPPVAPTNLTTSVDGTTVTFGWDKSTDTQTSQNGLTYNFYIGTSSGGAQVKSPLASTSTGYRRVVQLGNSNHKNSVQISLLCGVTYYWSVQAIDNSFAGSSFTSEQTVYVPEFTVQTSIALTGVSDGSVAWGDYDNDEDLDILLTGYTGSERISKIYKNTSGSFSDETSISLTSVYCSSVAWGDYDNDGDLDILLTGNSAGGKVTRIYNNNGDATFTQQSGISITGVDYSSVAWGDYDNDGDLDILLTGSGSSVISKIYINNGDRSFTLSEISLQGICIGSAAWGDYDNDNYLDILLTGSSTGGDGAGIAYIYMNNEDGSFTEEYYPTPVSSSSVAWGDYNNDGYLDFILTGYYASGNYDVSKIYKNDGDGTFTATSISLTGVSQSSVAWGDYDNDGDLDLLLTGLNGSTRISKIYKNNGDESFTEQTNISLTGVNRSSVAWGDYDNDGDLDILLTGYSGSAYVSKIYRNNANTANTQPSAPQNLNTIVDGNYVTFNWDKSTDSHTSQNGLTYNIYIGTTTLEVQKKSPMANTSTGYRKTVQLGNTNHNNSTSILFPQAGNYYWSVQAIDNNFMGSTFATEQSISISPVITEETSISLTGVSKSAVCWGDYDNDSDLDILLTGSTGTGTLTSKIYKNNGNGSFTAQAITLLTSIEDGSAVWVDYDNDGDLDIFLSGANVAQIWQNIESGVFTYQSGIPFQGVYHSSAAWGDYNNDGLLDLLLTGDLGGLAISKIYKNNGDQSFTEQTDILLVGVKEGSVAWGDYNNDGNLDLLLTGYDYVSNSFISKIYKNNGNNTFIEQSGISLTGVYQSSVKWGDYDNDGDFDILLAGLAGVTRITKIYKNNGNESFTEQSSISLAGVSDCSVAWGDYDNDGDLDILLTGASGTSTRISKIYNNNGSGEFEEGNILLTNVSESSVAWGDYDNDGDLDMLLTGLDGSTRITKIYKNNSPTANTSPTAPTNLSATVNGSSTTFSWNKSTDTETSQNGLTYNLFIGSTSGGVEKLTPMANITSGYRRIVQIGNTNHNNSITISGLTQGTYYWGIQAVDAGFKGSAFATTSNALPIELTNFNASCTGKKILLNWQTATEVNNYGFQIERKSFDAGMASLSHSADKEWQNVGFVEGHGNSDSNKEYSFTDKSINGGGKFSYRLKQIDIDGSYSYSETVEVTVLPNQFELSQNYPNPFNPGTSIKYQVSSIENVSLKVYDILGNEVATLVNERKEPGYYEVEFNASHLTSGVYFYVLRAGDKFNSVKKMILMK